MTWAAIGGGAVAGGLSLTGSLLGGDDSAESSTTFEPAQREPDQQYAWDTWLKGMFGGTDRNIDPSYYLKNNPDVVAAYEKAHPGVKLNLDNPGQTEYNVAMSH